MGGGGKGELRRYLALSIQLTQSGDASENPERLGFGSGNADFHDEVGGVSGGG